MEPEVVPPVAAASLLPSEEEATEDQVVIGALVGVQVPPELAEV
jgi:hypothetical protein